MPERTMAEAIERLEDAVQHMDDLAADIRSLEVSKRRLKILTVGLLVALIVLGLVSFLTVRGFNEQRERGCQNRNDSARVTRQFAEQQFAIFEAATQTRQATQDQLTLLEQLRHAVPKQSETEFDCNGDGELTAADYP
jgi:hypothetical protein